MEIVSNAIQVVNSNNNVLFTDTVVGCSNSLLHRSGSGLVTLRGNSPTQCRARYRAFFSGNIAVPTDGTVGPISLALAINGEAVSTTTMIYTPTVVDSYGNVASAVFIDVPKGCCFELSVRNTSDIDINVQNANLIVERVA